MVAKVVIVEDEFIIAEDLRMKINKLGHQVLAVSHSGKEAIKTVGKLKPDVVLMDICMDYNTDGIDACKSIKSKDKDVKVVFVSAYKPDMYKKELKDIKYDGFVNKFELTSVIHKYLK